jgi:hypothetical protein
MDFSLLRTRQLGMPSNFVELYTDCLSKSKFHFSSRGRTDDRFYSPATGYPVHGPGQGSRAATYSWTNDSTCALDVLSRAHCGATFCSPDQTLIHRRTIEAIVDDTSIASNQFHQELLTNQTSGWNHMGFRQFASSCIVAMQASAQHWEQLLWSTGGALELTKCWFYLSHWNFDAVGNAALLSRHQMSHYPVTAITLSNSAGGQYPITQYSFNETQRTLGYMSCPDGQQHDQFLMMRTKAREFSRALAATFATRQEADKFYRTIAIPTMTYANRISHLSQKQCNKLDSILLRTSLFWG